MSPKDFPESPPAASFNESDDLITEPASPIKLADEMDEEETRDTVSTSSSTTTSNQVTHISLNKTMTLRKGLNPLQWKEDKQEQQKVEEKSSVDQPMEKRSIVTDDSDVFGQLQLDCEGVGVNIAEGEGENEGEKVDEEGGVENDSVFISSVADDIYDDYGLYLKGKVVDIANSSKAYKRFGSIFLFVGPTYGDGIYLYHFKNKSIHLSVEEIQTIIFTASRVVSMYEEGDYQNYEGEVFNVILGRFKGVELYMGIDSVFINNIVTLEMRMSSFVQMYKFLLTHRSLFSDSVTMLPCAFTHPNKADFLGCGKCNKF